MSDDGAVLYIDGTEVINLDGSHFDATGFAFVNLAKGFHRLKLRYFEDCEGQKLEVFLAAPEGFHGSLPATRLYLP